MNTVDKNLVTPFFDHKSLFVVVNVVIIKLAMVFGIEVLTPLNYYSYQFVELMFIFLI